MSSFDLLATTKPLHPLEASMIRPPSVDMHAMGISKRTSPSNASFMLKNPPTARQRTQMACEKCRTRKTKCSGEKPVCARCAARGLICNYSMRDTRVRGPSKAKVQEVLDNRTSSSSSGSSTSPRSRAKANTLPSMELHNRDWKNVVGPIRSNSADASSSRRSESNTLGLTGVYRRPTSMILPSYDFDSTSLQESPFTARWDEYSEGAYSEPPSATRSHFSQSSTSSDYPSRPSSRSLIDSSALFSLSNPSSSSTASSSVPSPNSPVFVDDWPHLPKWSDRDGAQRPLNPVFDSVGRPSYGRETQTFEYTSGLYTNYPVSSSTSYELPKPMEQMTNRDYYDYLSNGGMLTATANRRAWVDGPTPPFTLE